jgi:hypothetical protein
MVLHQNNIHSSIKFIAMKKIICYTAIAFLTLSSCRKEGTTLAKDPALTQSQPQTNASSSGGAVTFSSVEIVHHDGDQIYNPCTGELMTIYGDVQFRTHGLTNDNNSVTTVNANVIEVKAIGESGTVYIISGAARLQWIDYSNGISTYKFRFYNRFISAGGNNNLIDEGIFYLMVDAEGNTTYLIDPIFKTYCQ